MDKRKRIDILLYVAAIIMVVIILSLPDYIDTAMKKKQLYDSPQAAFAACGIEEDIYILLTCDNVAFANTRKGTAYKTLRNPDLLWAYPKHVKLTESQIQIRGTTFFSRYSFYGKNFFEITFPKKYGYPSQVSDNVSGALEFLDDEQGVSKTYYSAISEDIANYTITVDGRDYAFELG